MRLRWRLPLYLKKRGIREWRLSRAIQGLGYVWDLRHIYRLRRPPRYLDLYTLEALLAGLRSLGHEATVGDLLVLAPSRREHLGASQREHLEENPAGFGERVGRSPQS